MYTDIQKREQIALEETNSNAISNVFPDAFTALARFTFIVSGDLYTTQESPYEFLCSPKPALYIVAPSQEEELRKEFEAWDAASDEIHGE